MTRDHSLVQELVEAGELTPEEAENHPNKNIVTKSIGQKTFLEPDLNIVEVQDQDYILMNSDGLTNMVMTSDILAIINSDIPLEHKAENLVNLANENGGLDNITVILLQLDEEDI